MGAEMTQPALFSESIYDALGDVVRALGGTKKVGLELKPEKPMEESSKWVKDCLNPERREKFDPEHIIWLLKKGREVGCHSAINYLCDEIGYERPKAIDPEDERAKLMRLYVEAVRYQKQLTERMERMSGTS
jgi:hypothetical protein